MRHWRLTTSLFEALGARAFFEAVRQLNLRDLTEYVPTTSTATQEITEDTRMRVTNRVYIINVAMSLQELPFVYHWQYADTDIPLRALVVTEIHNLPQPGQQRVSLQGYVLAAPPEVGLAICDALLMSLPHTGGKGKGKCVAGNPRNRVRQWNTFERQISGLATGVRNDVARMAAGATGPVPSVEVEVGKLHTVSPADFATHGGDGVCEHWPSPGTWLNTACHNRAGRAIVTPNSVMDPATWAVYIAHHIKCQFLGSVWPVMACESQHMLRGFVNDLEKSTFWLAVDAETLAAEGANQDAKQASDTEETWKGRLVWTIYTDELNTAPKKKHLGLRALAPWPAAHADICTSDHGWQVAHPVRPSCWGR